MHLWCGSREGRTHSRDHTHKVRATDAKQPRATGCRALPLWETEYRLDDTRLLPPETRWSSGRLSDTAEEPEHRA